MRIKRDDLVVEIGSGHNPRFRSDLLVDKFIVDNYHRAGKAIKIDRPLVAADAYFLPFRDKSIDYLLASHILEHLEDPGRFLEEIMRVAKQGYLETPSTFCEDLFGFRFHKYRVSFEKGKVLLSRISKKSKYSLLFEQLLKYDPYFTKWFLLQKNLFHSTFEWEDNFEYQILPEDHDFIDYKDIQEIKVLLINGYKEAKSIKNRVKAFLPNKAIDFLRKSLIIRRITRKKRDLTKILVCPACKKDLIFKKHEILCSNCHRSYGWKNNIPYLILTR